MTTRYYHDPIKLVKEYALGIGGIAITAGPAVLVEDILVPIAWVFWILSAIFALHIIKTAIRHKTVIELNETGVVSFGLFGKRHIGWDGLRNVQLSCFNARRGSAARALMILRLAGDDTKIVVESSLKGFDMFAETIAKMCQGRLVEMDITTRHNFEALGMPVAPKE